MKLFINAGGKGERLYPLTKDIPKPMVKIAGRPVLEHLVNWAKDYNMDGVVMMTGYKSGVIEDYFGNGNSFEIPISYSVEKNPLGSGGAIRHAKNYIDSTFVVISGDHICDVNLNSMINFHRKNNSQLTALIHESSHPHDSDVLNINQDYQVVGFISKRDDHTSAGIMSNSGLCILEPSILDLMDKEIFEFEGYLYPKIIESSLKMFAYKTNDFIADMGTPERLDKCIKYMESKT